MIASPAKMTTMNARTDPKEKARALRDRLLQGLDLIYDAQARGDQAKAATLQGFFDRLEAEYLEAKRAYSKTPEDLLRCPDCPHLGEGPLYEMGDRLVICDSPCPKEG